MFIFIKRSKTTIVEVEQSNRGEMITGDPNVDLKILSELDYASLVNVCQTNATMQTLCKPILDKKRPSFPSIVRKIGLPGVWVLKGTNYVVGHYKDERIIGKLVGKKLKSLKSQDENILKARDWKYEKSSELVKIMNKNIKYGLKIIKRWHPRNDRP